jgi:peroxiredoxin
VIRQEGFNSRQRFRNRALSVGRSTLKLLTVKAFTTIWFLLWHSVLSAPAAPRLPEPHSAPPEVGTDLLGTRPDAWTFDSWINSESLKLSQLRGKVVLVRWWTAPGCPYCEASAKSLENWWRTYRDEGLVVIGAYHHKGDSPLTPPHVAAEAKRLGFSFPVAIDRDWKTLRSWWLDKTDRGWTSVTFLIDRKGTIRFIHGGGAYIEGDPGHEALERALREAIKQR